MYLLTCATELEMKPLRESIRGMKGVDLLVTGVGLIETTLALSRYLTTQTSVIKGVINFGVCGAYMDAGVSILDICMAEKEILGDFGICVNNSIEAFAASLIPPQTTFQTDYDLLSLCADLLNKHQILFKQGTFVTVNGATGTTKRGNSFRDRHKAICENMEGAAVARVCQEFKMACLEIRCVSNMVEDRDVSKWRLDDACQKCTETVAAIVVKLNAE